MDKTDALKIAKAYAGLIKKQFNPFAAEILKYGQRV
jgi:hypothetical protein